MSAMNKNNTSGFYLREEVGFTPRGINIKETKKKKNGGNIYGNSSFKAKSKVMQNKGNGKNLPRKSGGR